MIHPHTILKPVNEIIGVGVFATSPIPMGTITYALDALDLHFTRQDPRLSDPNYKDIILKYSTRDPDGSYLMSWDIARYVNHCCHYNTLTTGNSFEIAVRDIAAGEEITDDYGVFNLEEPLLLACHNLDCRKYAYPDELRPHSGEVGCRSTPGALPYLLRAAAPFYLYRARRPGLRAQLSDDRSRLPVAVTGP